MLGSSFPCPEHGELRALVHSSGTHRGICLSLIMSLSPSHFTSRPAPDLPEAHAQDTPNCILYSCFKSPNTIYIRTGTQQSHTATKTLSLPVRQEYPESNIADSIGTNPSSTHRSWRWEQNGTQWEFQGMLHFFLVLETTLGPEHDTYSITELHHRITYCIF